jgi:hypothetical protein
MLLRLFGAGNNVTVLLLKLLTKEDILAVLSINKEIRSCI